MLYPSLEALRSAEIEWRWPHFSAQELSCKCGGKFCDGEYWHDEEFLDALEALRADLGVPLVINSGHRCPEHHKTVSKARYSRHLKIAADISLKGHDRYALRDSARRHGFTGIGQGASFLHVDRRAVPATWMYPGSGAHWAQ